MSKIFNFNFKQNFKQGFGKDSLIADACALITPLFYTVVPTFFKLSGAVAMLVGAGVPYLLGKALNVPSMSHAALAIAGQHAIYVYGGGVVQDVLGQPIWSLREINSTPAAPISPILPPIAAPVNGLNGYQRISANGDTLMAYNPSEIAQQAISYEEPGTSTINDYVRVAPNNALADNGVSWDDDSNGGGW